MVGATSGIGEALAHKMASSNIHVIAVGRRQSRLDAFTAQHGASASSSYAFDISAGGGAGIPAWSARVLAEHPDIDLVVLNSGVQRGLDFARPDTVDFATVRGELETNYTAHVALALAFLPHLQRAAAGGRAAAIVFTTSGLAMVPLVRCPNYSASKAALHAWILCLREQVRALPSGVKVVELLPPAVQTELHDAKHQPDIKDGGSIGMPLAEFTDRAWEGLCAGREQIPVGMAASPYAEGGFETKRQEAFRGMNGVGK